MSDDERRESLSDATIEKTIQKTIEALHDQREEIAEKAVKKVIEEYELGCPLGLKSDDEKKEFKETFDELSDLNDNIKATKRRTKWVGILFLAYILQDFFDFVIQIWNSFWDFFTAVKGGK